MTRSLSPRARKLLVGVVVGGLVGLLAALAAVLRPDVLARGEYWSYDIRARRAAQVEAPSPEIVVIDVTDQCFNDVLDNLDLPWPWPRELFGHLVKYASDGGARVVVLDWIFQDRGHYGMGDAETFADLVGGSARAVIAMAMYGTREGPPPPGAEARWAARLRRFPTRAEAERAGLRLIAWNTRAFLSPATGDGETTVSFGGRASREETLAVWERLVSADGLEDLFAPEGEAPAPAGDGDAGEGEETEPPPPAPPEVRALTDAELAGELTAARIVRDRSGIDLRLPPGVSFPRRGVAPPFPLFAAAAARLGVVTQQGDADGIMRRHTFLAIGGDRLYPSLPLAAYLVANPGIQPRLEGRRLVLGDRRVPLDEQGATGLRFTRLLQDGRSSYAHVRAYDVLRSAALREEGKPPVVDPALFRGKYVLVSAAAWALGDIKSTPVLRHHRGSEILANAIDNLLSGHFVTPSPRWFDALLTFLLALLLAVGMVATWSAIGSPALSFLAMIALAGAATYGYWTWASHVFVARGLAVPVTTPILGAVVSTVAAVLVASVLERRDRRFVQEALGRYTSDELVAELVEHPEHLSLEWGQLREMTVYFSDIAGFTSFSEALPPSRLVRLLNEYLTEMTDIVLAHGGIVDKYIGDAIMAFWGAPLPAPDHARKAVLAALAMRRRCDELRPKWKAEYGHLVVARGGVNSGQAVVGNMGSRHKYNYTAMGDMVNLASRLEGANKPYGTTLMISETTYAATKDLLDVRELDLLAVKGKDRPVTVYEPLAEKGQADPVVLEAVGHFHAGLARYRAREFADAIARFERALAVRPDDAPSRAYVERCRRFLEEPPGPSWDGVWHMKEK